LKRRRAFSRDLPSCNLTSANETAPPDCSNLDSSFIASYPSKVKNYVDFVTEVPGVSSHPVAAPQRKIPRCNKIGSGLGCLGFSRLHEIRRGRILSREVVDSKTFISEVVSTQLACRHCQFLTLESGCVIHQDNGRTRDAASSGIRAQYRATARSKRPVRDAQMRRRELHVTRFRLAASMASEQIAAASRTGKVW
jgi:hypothetical protein